jgi:hypothetical protein
MLAEGWINKKILNLKITKIIFFKIYVYLKRRKQKHEIQL